MPNRIIKEGICTSEQIDMCGCFEEVMFYRLLVNCDDFGRFDARPAILRTRLFPLKKRLTAKQVEKALESLARIGLIERYQVDGKPYLQLPGWSKHQCIRAKKSKFPGPESTCTQLHADAGNCARNPIQSESESKSESETKTVTRDDFDVFWVKYPRKEGKEKARTAFEYVNVPLEVLLKAVEAQKGSAQWTNEGGRYIPSPATWLRDKRWEDQLPGGEREKRRLDEDEVRAIRLMMESEGGEEHVTL